MRALRLSLSSEGFALPGLRASRHSCGSAVALAALPGEPAVPSSTRLPSWCWSIATRAATDSDPVDPARNPRAFSQPWLWRTFVSGGLLFVSLLPPECPRAVNRTDRVARPPPFLCAGHPSPPSRVLSDIYPADLRRCVSYAS